MCPQIKLLSYLVVSNDANHSINHKSFVVFYRYRYVPNDGIVGIKDPSDWNKWTGVLGMVVNDTCDLAIGSFYVTLERKAVVDFPSIIYNAR